MNYPIVLQNEISLVDATSKQLNRLAPIQSIDIEPLKFPEASNSFAAVTKATLVTQGNQIFSDIGTSSGLHQNAGDALMESITNAKLNVFQTAIACVSPDIGDVHEQSCNERSSPIIDVTPQQHSYTAHPKDALNGGGDKSASPSQKNLIKTIANERGVQLTDMTQSLYGKDYTELTGAEANGLIKSLKAGKC